MFTSIHERVKVSGVFSPPSPFMPRKFKWQNKIYKIDAITLVSDFKDAGLKKRMYSITTGINLYRLIYIRDHEEWWLEEVWME